MYIIIFVRVIATVAQSVEQLIRNQQVRGSNPLGSFYLKTGCQRIVAACFLLQFLTNCILFLIPVFEILQELIEQ